MSEAVMHHAVRGAAVAALALSLSGSPETPRTVPWHAASPGVELSERTLDAPSGGWRTRLIVARVDPRRVTLGVAVARREDGRGTWSVDDAPARALLAVNAGQFGSYEPWGWIVRDGRELQPPGTGPLSAALVVAMDGTVRLVPADSVARVRAAGGVRAAVQSYPVLLHNGAPPPALMTPGSGVDLEHRDARLAIGVLADGRLVIALTRFDALGEPLGALPLGPTVPEMARVMRDLGCRSAMLLDGGISAQLRVLDAGADRTWHGLRLVPVGLVAVAR